MSAQPDLSSEVQQALGRLEQAAAEGELSAGAVEHIRQWLTDARYAAYAPQVAQHIAEGKWRELDAVFWTVIPFGTGGRRGRMYPIGTNAINDRTIGESAQGLADYVKSLHPAGAELRCAVAYDTRRNSRRFAELCAGIMAAAGFEVYLLDDYRSTPELSFLVRLRQCACGLMITASHNPPSDNAVKVYWSTGGQVLPPHDQKIIERVMQVQDVTAMDFHRAVSEGRVRICTEETDQAYQRAVLAQGFPGPRDADIVYSPLHGVGASAVMPILDQDGFAGVELFGPHAEPNGDFPNVPGHVSNPENPRVFDAIIERGRQRGADLVLATDPDCDRMGAAAPAGRDPRGPWVVFTGNQLGALLADFVLARRAEQGKLSGDHYLVKTLVTTELIRRVGEHYGVRTVGDLLVGFKWIGGAIDQQGPERFVLGAEESHGYLVGQYARDKDGPVACMLMAELAARLKAEGKTLVQQLDELYRRHGLHAERLITAKMEGAEGMARMKEVMARFRQAPPRELGGLPVAAIRDYLNNERRAVEGGAAEPLAGPTGDLVFLDFAESGNCLAARPSGTEPKIKFYLFVYTPPAQLGDLEGAKQAAQARLDAIERDLRRFAGVT